jgi:hypothetical protein
MLTQNLIIPLCLNYEEVSNEFRTRGIISLGSPWDFPCFWFDGDHAVFVIRDLRS